MRGEINKKGCNHTNRTSHRKISFANNLQHKKNQTLRPERQQKTRKWHREKPAKKHKTKK